MKQDINPYQWDHSAAGHVDEGEEPFEAAKRELYEELGVKAKLKLIGQFKTQEILSWKKLNRFWYLYICRHNGPFNLNKKEILSGKFVNLVDLRLDMEKNLKKYTVSFYKTLDQYFFYKK